MDIDTLDLEAILLGNDNIKEIMDILEEEYNYHTSFDTVIRKESEKDTIRFSELKEDIASPELEELPEITYRSKETNRMKNKFDALDEQLRKILAWRNGQDKSMNRRRNIAKVLGISPKKVYKLEKQAIELLRKGE